MTKDAAEANYQLQITEKDETQLEMVKKFHLPLDAYKRLKAECEKHRIEFMSTPFDEVSIETLKKLELKRYKIPSGEITKLPYLRHIGGLLSCPPAWLLSIENPYGKGDATEKIMVVLKNEPIPQELKKQFYDL